VKINKDIIGKKKCYEFVAFGKIRCIVCENEFFLSSIFRKSED